MVFLTLLHKKFTMIRSDKKLKALSDILKNGDNTLIVEAISLLREEQPFEGAIGLLTLYFNRTDDSSIKKAIGEFMNDLKDQSASSEIITEIRKQWKEDTIGMLVSSCWQSGLDYSAYSIDLARVFLAGDYVTALECLTVIEESVKEISRERKDEIIRIVEESPASDVNEKTSLKLELISILRK
jgi:hypothetical protein